MSKRKKSVESDQLHHMDVDSEILNQKSENTSKTDTDYSSCNKNKESNLKERNGQQIIQNDKVTSKSDSLQPEPQQSSSKDSKKQANDCIKIQIPDYLMVTKIPMAGTVYTCLHCEQTFVNQSAACAHRCNRLLHLSPLR